MTHYGYLEGCVMKQAAAAVATPAAAAAAAATTCAGCRRPIRDQYIFRVLPDLEWHADCLRCCECQAYLDETCTCFVRHGRVYCKSDYLRMFSCGGGGVSAARCAKCTGGFGTTEYVTKVAGRIYHVNCFACSLCDRRLVTGEKFYLSPSTNEPICDGDHVAVATSSQASSPTGIGGDMNIADDEKDNNKSPASTSGSSSAQANSVKESSSSTFSQPTKTRKSKKGSDKPTRVRTVLTEKQLHTLRTCYAANPRPDALMKEQLCEMTGLSPRVIRVWFQNKRCKDKKKSLMVGGGGNSRMQDSPPLGQILQPAMTKEPGPPPPLPPPSFPQAESNSMPPLPGLPNIPSSPGLTAVACQSPTVPMPPTPTLPQQRQQQQYQHMVTIEQELHQSPHTPTTPASCHYAGYPPVPSPLATPPAAGYFAMPSPTVTMPPSPHPYLTQQQSSWPQFASRATTTTAHPRAAYSGEIYRDHPIF